MTVVGVDGCGGGWLAAILESDTLDTAVYEDFSSLWDAHEDADRVLVDVPIGIPSDEYRGCDQQARTLLGSQWNAVFRTPVRDALAYHPDSDATPDGGGAEDPRASASAVQEGATGTKISVQTWNIAPLILELDTFVRERGGLPATLREAHPEVTFWALNGGQPVAYSKTSAAGRRLRRSLLDPVLPGARPAYDEARERYRKRTASDDDVVDALALAAAASEGTPDLVSLPFSEGDPDALSLARAATADTAAVTVAFPDGEAPTDETGVPMEIAFPRPLDAGWLRGG